MKKPFVMIDGMNLGLEKGTGVATYARNLSYGLRDIGCEVGVLYGGRSAPGAESLLKEIAFFDSNVGKPPKWLAVLLAVQEAVIPGHGFTAAKVEISGRVIYDTFKSKMPYFDNVWNSRRLFERARASFTLWRILTPVTLPRTPDVMHWTYPIPLSAKDSKNIYTLHDLVPLRLPYTTLDNKRRYYRLVRKIAAKADHIVTVSECSKKDLISLLGIPEEKITNTYESVNIPAKYRDKPEDVVKREIEGTFGLKHRGYFLFYGSIEPKKNIGRLIEGYLASNVPTPLVIVGAQAWKSEQELRLTRSRTAAIADKDQLQTHFLYENEKRVRRRIIQLEYAPFNLLVSLIRGAKATVFPSLYEGFGLPVLESMLLGTPVLSSNTSSIPEVAGNAALLVDPYDTRAIAEGIRELDSNAELRAGLVAKGRKQAEVHSEEKHKQRLETLYARLTY